MFMFRPFPPPGHAETDPSVAHTVAARTRKIEGGGYTIKPDISKLG